MSFRVPWLVHLLRRVGFLLLVSASITSAPRAAWTMGGVPRAQAGSNPTLEGKYWRATELVGKPTPAQDSKREAHLMFQPLGRFSGSDGCNRLTGGYELKGDAISFGGMAMTRMACEGTGEVERAFAEALKRVTRLSLAGDRLDFFDAAGERVATFTATDRASSSLEGTSSQLTTFGLSH